MNVTITRESQAIWLAVSDSPYWSDGSAINERLALSGDMLSNSKAQSIDRASGNGYILISPFGIKRSEVVAAAKSLPVGASFTFSK